MKIVVIDKKKYELIKDYKDGFDETEIGNRITEYFDDYDYIVGDWSYGKLRLKGFCDKKNKNYKTINDIKELDAYLKKYCSYECRYFVIKKMKD